MHLSWQHNSTCNGEEIQFVVCSSQCLRHCEVILQGEMEQQVIWSQAGGRQTDLHFGQKQHPHDLSLHTIFSVKCTDKLSVISDDLLEGKKRFNFRRHLKTSE